MNFITLKVFNIYYLLGFEILFKMSTFIFALSTLNIRGYKFVRYFIFILAINKKNEAIFDYIGNFISIIKYNHLTNYIKS